MASLHTNHYLMLQQKCKDCPHLIIKPDGIHIDCDPPMGECPLNIKERIE